MEFSKVEHIKIDVPDAIRKRVSTRGYDSRALSDKDRESLMGFYKSLTNPFGLDVRLQYISKEYKEGDVKLGTYGTIKGAKDFLAVTVKDVPFAMEAVGYQFENLVLYATKMGLGTVWLAGTFNRKDFERVMKLAQDDLFPCISPIGYPLEKQSLLEKFTRTALSSSKRKSWDRIFFEHDFENKLDENAAGPYKNALEMLRLAPSSTNCQPWAVVKEGDKFHFFNQYKKNTNEFIIKIRRVDFGIGLAHFHQTALGEGLNGNFTMEEIKFIIPEDMNYVLTYNVE